MMEIAVGLSIAFACGVSMAVFGGLSFVFALMTKDKIPHSILYLIPTLLAFAISTFAWFANLQVR